MIWLLVATFITAGVGTVVLYFKPADPSQLPITSERRRMLIVATRERDATYGAF